MTCLVSLTISKGVRDPTPWGEVEMWRSWGRSVTRWSDCGTTHGQGSVE